MRMKLRDHLIVLESLVLQEDYLNAAWQRDFLLEAYYCRKRVEIGEERGLQAMKTETREFLKSGMNPEEWKRVRRRRMMEIGVIPYDLIRYRSPFRN